MSAVLGILLTLRLLGPVRQEFESSLGLSGVVRVCPGWWGTHGYVRLPSGAVVHVRPDPPGRGVDTLPLGEPGCAAFAPRAHRGDRYVFAYYSGATDGNLLVIAEITDSVRFTSYPVPPPSGWGFAWSPDDSAIAFNAGPGIESRVAVLELASGAVHVLTDPGSPMEEDRVTGWSRDGKYIAFIRGTTIQRDIMDPVFRLAVPRTGGAPFEIPCIQRAWWERVTAMRCTW